MDFDLSEEQVAICEQAQRFAQTEMATQAADWDRDSTFPAETLRKAAAMGFAGMNVAEHLGGAGLPRLTSALIYEILARACPSTTAFISIHNMVCWLIETFGNAEQHQHWLPRLLQMEIFASYCLTEPQSGSDAAALQMRAVRDGDHYILNGAKAFISGGGVSDLYACMVRTGGNDYHGISCVLIEKGTKGLKFGQQEKKLGWHSQPTSMVFFEDCRVPVTNLIGAEGHGFKMALQALNGGRVNIAACSLGGASACFDHARRYVSERQQFKQPLNQFQNTQFKLADMLTDYHAARLMVHRAAWALDHKHPESVTYCAMAKRVATDWCFKITDRALQLHGGYGYLQDYPIERYFRDLRVHQILEGTNEIMRLMVARRILQDNFQHEY